MATPSLADHLADIKTDIENAATADTISSCRNYIDGALSSLALAETVIADSEVSTAGTTARLKAQLAEKDKEIEALTALTMQMTGRIYDAEQREILAHSVAAGAL